MSHWIVMADISLNPAHVRDHLFSGQSRRDTEEIGRGLETRRKRCSDCRWVPSSIVKIGGGAFQTRTRSFDGNPQWGILWNRMTSRNAMGIGNEADIIESTVTLLHFNSPTAFS
jgi:hypothetical protein